jgi:hypothetical protein
MNMILSVLTPVLGFLGSSYDAGSPGLRLAFGIGAPIVIGGYYFIDCYCG